MDKLEAIKDVIDKNTIKLIKPQIDYQKIFINYFDLGLRNGWELDKFIDFCNQYNIKYRVHGFEACKTLYDQLNLKYSLNKNIDIHHLAVASIDNQLIKLYYANDPDGNSIFKTKNNLKNTERSFELCNTIKLSTFIKNIQKEDNTINIIKANIEGAEYDVIKDLHNEKQLNYFDYYIGAGWTTDMNYITELKSKVQEIKSILIENNIKTYYFARGWNQFNNINFNDLIHS